MNPTNLIILFICLFGSYYGVSRITPMVIRIATRNNLMDNPNNRSSHKHAIPRLGGIGIFFSLVVGMFVLQGYESGTTIISLLTCFTLLFLVGLKDDIAGVNPITKLITQIICAGVLAMTPGFQLDLLNQVFNIPGFNAAYLIFLLVPAVVNSFNLIDGIDGLASIVGITIISTLSIPFLIIHDYLFFGICLLLVGSLIAFMRFNINQSGLKTFLGDTGSMIIGVSIAALVIHLLSYDIHTFTEQPIPFKHIPFFLIAVLFIPIYDTTRIFIVRIAKKQSPFKADTCHTHHLLLFKYNFSHVKTSLLIGGFNVFFINVMFLLSLYTNPFVLGTTLIVTVGLLTFYFYKITKDREQFFASENIDPEITAIKKERNTRSVALLNKRISNNTHHQSKKHAKTNIYNILAKFSKIW